MFTLVGAKINYGEPILSAKELGKVLVQTSFHTTDFLSFKTQNIQKEKAADETLIATLSDIKKTIKDHVVNKCFVPYS